MYVFNSNEELGGTGALKFSSAMANSKKALTHKTEHVTQNNPTGPGPSGVRENIFHLFRSSASGNTTWHRSVLVSAKTVKFLPAPMDR